jgi:hypothetical protein
MVGEGEQFGGAFVVDFPLKFGKLASAWRHFLTAPADQGFKKGRSGVHHHRGFSLICNK